MKKSTKKVIAALVIILIFGMSSIAFVASSAFNGGQQQQQFQPLTSYVVQGDLDPTYETIYVQNGFTWVKFYYTDADPLFMSFMDSLPTTYTTNTGQQQIIVQKINQAYGNSTNHIIISSSQGYDELSNPEDDVAIVTSLCRLLISPPIECIFGMEQNQTVENATADANGTAV